MIDGDILGSMENTSNCFTAAGDKVCRWLARPPVKEACAEFLATFVLVVIGDGVMASCVLGRLNLNGVLAGAFGWGLALMIAVAISGGVSGGHVNPAVTVGLASGKMCAWRNILPFIIAQYVGSFLGAVLVYSTYIDAIHEYDGGFRQIPPAENATAQIFATYPQSFASVYTCIVDQVLGTALLLILICAVTDLANLRIPPHGQPVLTGLGLTAILLAFGHNCGGPLNPARDFAPRLFTAISGWGLGVFGHRNYEWFWIPVFAPHIGGIVGVWLYKALIALPFKNYSQLLQEMETPTFVDPRKCSLFLDIEKQPLSRSSSENGSTLRRTLEQIPEKHEPSAIPAPEKTPSPVEGKPVFSDVAVKV